MGWTDFKKEPRRCIVCNRVFMPKTANQLTCSTECSRKHNSELTKQRSKGIYVRSRPKKIEDPMRAIREIAKNGVNYGKMVAEAEYHVTVDKVFEDNMDEIRQG